MWHYKSTHPMHPQCSILCIKLSNSQRSPNNIPSKLHLFIFILHYWIFSFNISCDSFPLFIQSKKKSSLLPRRSVFFETVRWSSLEMHFFHSRRDLCKLPLGCGEIKCIYTASSSKHPSVNAPHKSELLLDVESKLTQKIASAFTLFISLFT
jgi:hypothetical protein